MASPAFKVEVAFSTDPLGVPGAWTDISKYVREGSGRRGRTHELGQSQSGELTLRLTNTDRRFEPGFAAGAYYPNVVPMKQIRVTATHNAVTYPVFYGYVEDWKQTWPGRPITGLGDAECILHAADGFKLLRLYTLRNTYKAEVLSDAPDVYFPMDEDFGTTVLNGVGGTGAVSTGQLGVAGPLIGGATAYQAAAASGTTTGGAGSPAPIVGPGGGGNLYPGTTFEAWVYITGNPVGAPCLCINADEAVGSMGMLNITMDSTRKLTVYGGDIGGSGAFASVTDAAWVIPLATWTHLVVERTSLNAGGAGMSFVDVYINGSKAGTTHQSNTTGGAFPLTPMGTITQFMAVSGDEIVYGRMAHGAIYGYPLSAQRVAAHHAATLGSIAAGKAGAQIGLLLDQMGWPAGLRTLDTGDFYLQQFDPNGSALEHLPKIGEDAERGLVQMSADGKVVFHDRSSMLSTTGSHGVSQATYGDGGGAEIAYEDLGIGNDDQDLWPTVSVSRSGGATMTASDAAGVIADGPRVLPISADRLAFDDDAELIAQYLSFRYRKYASRPLSVDLDLTNDITANAAILSRDTHHDRVTVLRRPPGGGATDTLDCHVEGIEFAFTPTGISKLKLGLVPDPGITFPFEECLVASPLNSGVTSSVSGAGSSAALLGTAIPNRPGIIELITGTTTTGRSALIGITDAVQLGALDCVYQGAVAIPTASDGTNRFTLRMGLGDSASAESVDFIGFRYTDNVNGGKWQAVTRKNSVETAVDTGQIIESPTPAWHKWGFRVNTAGTSVVFLIDGVTVATISTNIPTGSSRKLTYLPGFILKSLGTAARSFYVDRFAYILAP